MKTMLPLLLLGLVSTCSSQPDQEESSPTQVPPTPTPPCSIPAFPPDSPLPAELLQNVRKVHVAYAVDGDTLELDNLEGERVRLIGIDTPESYGEVECYGPEAKAYAHALIDDQDACLVYDPAVTADTNGTNEDLYDRTLAYIFFGEGYARMLNGEMLVAGYAEDWAFTDGAMFESYFYDLEAAAKAADVGMWGACENPETH